ncbi:branched-chain amino acid transport system / permease component family protein [Bordetella holmesii 41130]|nr:branched-chain amino acid transport system / permease component family protein [Bordetella holmesii 41130]
MFEALSAGLFNGLIYAAVAVGLALIWGITDVINFAHGEFLMLGMYSAYWMYTLGHLDPTLSAPLVAIVLAFVGFLTYALIIKRLQKGPAMAVILATFGLGLVLRQLAFIAFSPDYRSLPDTLISGSVSLAGVSLGRPQVVTGLVALAMVVALFFLVYRTCWGMPCRPWPRTGTWRRWWGFRPTASMRRSGCWAVPPLAWQARCSRPSFMCFRRWARCSVFWPSSRSAWAASVRCQALLSPAF